MFAYKLGSLMLMDQFTCKIVTRLYDANYHI